MTPNHNLFNHTIHYLIKTNDHLAKSIWRTLLQHKSPASSRWTTASWSTSLTEEWTEPTARHGWTSPYFDSRIFSFFSAFINSGMDGLDVGVTHTLKRISGNNVFIKRYCTLDPEHDGFCPQADSFFLIFCQYFSQWIILFKSCFYSALESQRMSRQQKASCVNIQICSE